MTGEPIGEDARALDPRTLMVEWGPMAVEDRHLSMLRSAEPLARRLIEALRLLSRTEMENTSSPELAADVRTFLARHSGGSARTTGASS